MKWLGLLAISTAVYASSVRVTAQAHIRCQNTIGGPCGDSSRPREYNCCDYGYCQPWNSGYYQCLNKPDKCPTQETDIDYAGNDIKTIRGILPDKCCEECSNTAGCTVYTFVNQNPDGKSACYLKSSAAGRVEKKGAVSGALSTIPPPPKCPVQERGVDYYGNDLKTVTGVDWYGCCDECAKTAKCVGYTYIEQTNSCYLKSSTAGKVAKVGAISGKVKEDPVTTAPPTTEPPPAKCSVQENDIDYYGNDLKSVTGVFQGACCDECVKTDRCIAYSFVPATSSSKTGTCYLKSATAGKVAKPGVFSGVVDGSWTQPPITLPPPPSNCPVQYNNIDFFGNDLKTLYALTQGGCCDECTKMPGCMAYTFVAKNSDGRTACYLKASTRGQVAKIGAVSGTPRYIQPPANCPNQELNIEYAGFDIKEVKGLTYGQCCDACGTTAGCRATTYLETNTDGKSSCFLKSNAIRKASLTGAISSVYKCPTPLYGSCGSAATGALCCPYEGYCQPWNSKYYQCVPPPDAAKCQNLQTNVDFYGGDIEVKYGLQPGDCCDACFKNMKCIAYTFVNENPDGKTACYLKDRVGEKRAKLGAVSGYRRIEA